MNINSRHYTLLLFALCSIIASGLGYFFIYKKTASLAQHYAQASSEISNESAKKHYEQEIIDAYKETALQYAKISSFFIPEDSAVDFIEQLEKVGSTSRTNLTLSGLSTDKSSIKAKADIEGSWTAVMNALRLLENLPFSAVMSDVRLDTSGDLAASDKKAPSGRVWHLSVTIEALTKKTVQ